MKKTLLAFALACAALFLTQCRKAIFEQTGGNLTGETIEVSLNVDNGGSKTVIDGNVVKWKTGDKLYVVGETDGCLGHISAQNDGVSAYFTGAITKVTTAQKFHYYYIGDDSKEFTLDGDLYTYDISSQTGKIDDITKNLHLMHGVSDSPIAVGTTNLGTIAMTSMISIVKLQFSMASGVKETLGDKVICTGGCSAVKFNVKSGSFDSENRVRYKKNIYLNEVTTSVDGIYYMIVIPGTQTLEFSQGLIGKSYRCPDGGFAANTFYSNVKSVELGELPYLPAIFTVNNGSDGIQGTFDDTQVKFSKGNLQYIGSATSPYWKFAEHQFEVVGGSQATAATNVDRDLFGWGTSGYHQSSDGYNKHYLPYSTSNTPNDKYKTNRFGYGPSTNVKPEGPSPSTGNVSGSYYDWGVYNDISNDGSLGVGSWRTLTGDECGNLINNRLDASSHYGFGTVGTVHGLIVLPDEWIGPTVRTGGNFDTNTYSDLEWKDLEFHGAVFLPVEGYRYGTPITDEGSIGRYWSGTYNDYGNSQILSIKLDNNVCSVGTGSSDRCAGYSVRLVRDAE
ncbi:MAG: hypothetical protein Q4F69_11575 [Bacteroidia bacterium]|nr:hypothetical protein [Bacteroidia bacterium]